MENIKIEEKDKKRIQKFIKQETGFYGYEQDIELLEQNGELTEELARKVFTEIMNDAHNQKKIVNLKKKLKKHFQDTIKFQNQNN